MDADIHSLLSRPAWIKSLARSLASDPHQADDLVQDTWVAALTRPPRSGVPLPRWVAKVMRNAVVQRHRSEGRRREREASVARHELDLTSEQLLARFDLQRSLADAVAELREPYRTAILLRYFEDLAPREIAERAGVPVRTVHSRLHRGLELLRERLAPCEADERRTWMGALGALGQVSKPLEVSVAKVPIAGALFMSTKLKLAAGLVAAVGLFFIGRAAFDVERAPSRASESGEALTAAVALEPAPRSALAEAPTDEGRRAIQPESVPEVSAEPDGFADVAPVVTPLLGRVIDLSGFPVAGVPVVYVGFGHSPDKYEPVFSDGQGRFEFAHPLSSGQIDAVGDDWATVLQPRHLDGLMEEPVLVVAPAITISGVVQDSGGAPVTGAKLSLGFPTVMRSKLNAIVDESHQRGWETKSDERGRFEFPRVPGVAGTTLHASAQDHDEHSRSIPLEGDRTLVIELVRSESPAAVLEGLIVDTEGQPVPGGWASLGETSAKANKAGRFRLTVPDEDEGLVLRATAEGYLPTELEAHPGRELEAAFPDPLVLVLSDRPARIAGRVLDSEGEPAVGVQVGTPDESHFANVAMDPDADDPWFVPQTIEAMARGDELFFWEPCTTNENGEFALEGLMPHAYTVCAWDESTHRFAQSAPTDPGGFVELRLPPTSLRPRVAGTVLGLGGAPVVGAKVRFGTEVTIASALGDEGPRDEKRYGGEVRTDEQGRFEFTGVPHSAGWIHIRGGDLAESHEELLAGDLDYEALEFRLPMRCRMQVVLQAGLAANRLQVLDDDGEPIALVVKHGWVATGSHWHTLREGRSEILRVSERARTLVLYDGNEELVRVPLQLDPEELVTLRP